MVREITPPTGHATRTKPAIKVGPDDLACLVFTSGSYETLKLINQRVQGGLDTAVDVGAVSGTHERPILSVYLALVPPRQLRTLERELSRNFPGSFHMRTVPAQIFADVA